MKKISIILLMLVYSLSSSGIPITVHYCMSKIVGWELSGTTGGFRCEKCGMKKQGHKGCCNDEKRIIKTQKDQKTVEAFVHLAKYTPAEISNNYLIYPSSLLPNPTEKLSFSHGPPDKLKVPIYINNCVFRI